MINNTTSDTDTYTKRLAALAASTERYKQHNDSVEASLPPERRLEIQARIRKTMSELRRTSPR